MYSETDRLERLALLENEAIRSHKVRNGDQMFKLILVEGSIQCVRKGLETVARCQLIFNTGSILDFTCHRIS